jgi:hypothetical protein
MGYISNSDALSSHQASRYYSVSNLASQVPTNGFHLPKVPPSNDGFTAVLTPENLVVQAQRAVVIAEVESCVLVLVLNF